MARRGTFGRTPRAVPSLTNTLVAIAREQEMKRDQNIMDAWRNGGQFEGAKVTDDMVLEHWRQRMTELSVDDPAYDSAKNAVTQLEYTIAESKQTVLHAQKKISDGQLANFYLGWAKKVPKDSEFYRVLQRDAAALLHKVKASNAAEIARAKEEKYQRTKNNLMDKYYKPAEYVTNAFRALCQTYPELIGGASDFDDMTVMDANVLTKVFSKLNAGGDEPIYEDPVTKKMMSANDFFNGLREIDPGFTGNILTPTVIQGFVSAQEDGASQIYKLARKTGHSSDANAASAQREYSHELGRQTDLWTTGQVYNAVMAKFNDVADDPTATVEEVDNAWKLAAGQLTTLAKDPRLDDDLRTRNMLLNEANGVEGGFSFREDFIGTGNPKFTSEEEYQPTDIAMRNERINSGREQIDAVNSGKAVWVTGSKMPDGTFNYGVGDGMMAMPVEEVESKFGANYMPARVGDGTGKYFDIVVPLSAVKVEVADPFNPTTGQLKPTTEEPSVFSATVTSNGKTTTLFAVMAPGPDGKPVPRVLKEGITPWGDNTAFDGYSYGEDGSITVKFKGPQVGADGRIPETEGFTVTQSSTTGAITGIQFDPKAMLIGKSFDANFNNDEISTPSLTMGVFLSSTDDAKAKAKGDPGFNNRVIADNYIYAGYKFDETSGTWIGGNKDYFDKGIYQLWDGTGNKPENWIPNQTRDPQGKFGPTSFMSDGSKNPNFGVDMDPEHQSKTGVLAGSVWGAGQAWNWGPGAPNPAEAVKGTPMAGIGAAWQNNSTQLAGSGTVETNPSAGFGLKLPGLTQPVSTDKVLTTPSTSYVDTMVKQQQTQAAQQATYAAASASTGGVASSWAMKYRGKNTPQ